ncbi:geranylgeranyl pyrophosphate synthase [Candidatus Termititenax persephonae]|uniref:Geranylgeranyl pyrophosphate synthase n=1 Tax=Candidatus Termititenax persephonae TaxID=2218525 RepID=A0A388TJG5_9BACT|nr:geranylgeranyl pyrophosphate synthase [Candidatus Termititenax persephonae]
MPHKLAGYLAQKTALIEKALAYYLAFTPDVPPGLVAAMHYAVLNGGKRIRPILLLAAAELLGVDEGQIMPAACAVEMVHAYSLAHDDLPCMDDDDLRRGRPSCHKKFGEATALLAGDTLQAYAYEIVARDCPPAQALTLIAQLGRASGVYGMAGGQAWDLAGTARTLPELQEMHALKTGALLEYAVTAPLCLAQADAAVRRALHVYAAAIGLAFQIKDDILDAEGTAEILGKTPGKDVRGHKATYVTLLGMAKAKELLAAETTKAYQSARIFGTGNILLVLARHLLERKN